MTVLDSLAAPRDAWEDSPDYAPANAVEPLDGDEEIDVDVMIDDFAGAGYRPDTATNATGLLDRLRRPAKETRPVWSSSEPPAAGASFDDKMAYYRSQHRSVGVRATHLVGIPGAAASLPLLLARPKVGAAVFVASWTLQVAGHRLFERNNPALTKGFVSYQLCGLAFWCEEMGDLISRR